MDKPKGPFIKYGWGGPEDFVKFSAKKPVAPPSNFAKNSVASPSDLAKK